MIHNQMAVDSLCCTISASWHDLPPTPGLYAVRVWRNCEHRYYVKRFASCESLPKCRSGRRYYGPIPEAPNEKPTQRQIQALIPTKECD